VYGTVLCYSLQRTLPRMMKQVQYIQGQGLCSWLKVTFCVELAKVVVFSTHVRWRDEQGSTVPYVHSVRTCFSYGLCTAPYCATAYSGPSRMKLVDTVQGLCSWLKVTFCVELAKVVVFSYHVRWRDEQGSTVPYVHSVRTCFSVRHVYGTVLCHSPVDCSNHAYSGIYLYSTGIPCR
jgi:hypothetical protein